MIAYLHNGKDHDLGRLRPAEPHAATNRNSEAATQI
jgi:hypothetical protein